MPSPPASPRGCSTGEARPHHSESHEPAHGGGRRAVRRSHELATRRAVQRPPVVLLGEASHGTAEFYQARARITEMLVDRHGFNIVAVEADWPDAAVYRRLRRAACPVRRCRNPPSRRFPTWMWRNGQVAEFLDRLKAINATIGDRSEGRLLWTRYLQPRRLDRGGVAISRQGRSQAARSRASVTAASCPGAPSRPATVAWRCRAATPFARSRSPMR